MVERKLRLRRDWDVRQVRSHGKAFADGPLVVRIAPNDTNPAQNRYTVIAGKKVGNSVERNRCKRVVREALRHLHPALQPGHDVVVIIRGGVDELTGYPVARAVLERVFSRSRLVTAPELADPGPQPAVAPVGDKDAS